MSRQCGAITRDGTRCQKSADSPNGLCWAHDPQHAAQRSALASRAGRAKGNKEVADLKAEIKDLITEVNSGELNRKDAAVMVQAYRALLEYIKLERNVYIEEDLAARLRELQTRSELNSTHGS